MALNPPHIHHLSFRSHLLVNFRVRPAHKVISKAPSNFLNFFSQFPRRTTLKNILRTAKKLTAMESSCLNLPVWALFTSWLNALNDPAASILVLFVQWSQIRVRETHPGNGGIEHHRVQRPQENSCLPLCCDKVELNQASATATTPAWLCLLLPGKARFACRAGECG